MKNLSKGKIQKEDNNPLPASPFSYPSELKDSQNFKVNHY